jgi:hypothetical protein
VKILRDYDKFKYNVIVTDATVASSDEVITTDTAQILVTSLEGKYCLICCLHLCTLSDIIIGLHWVTILAAAKHVFR